MKERAIYNKSNDYLILGGYYFPPKEYVTILIDQLSSRYREIRGHKDIWFGSIDSPLIDKSKLRRASMNISVFNTAHFSVEIGQYKFKAFEEKEITLSPSDSIYREMRTKKFLRVGKQNNDLFRREFGLKDNKKIFNFCYDVRTQSSGLQGIAYKGAIDSLANPIIKFLPSASLVNLPLVNLNIRFFSSKRINEQGKVLVGPKDIFFSHGIADKNYWIGNNINDFNYAFVPGQAWERRMRNTGYRGEIFVCGYTKLDPLLNGEYFKNDYQKPCVVWMPTHGYVAKDKGRSSFPDCLNLIKDIPSCYESRLALHPTSKMNMVSRNKKILPTMQELIDADVVIADAGSTLYEAWILGKPVIFPDWLCKNDILRHFKHDINNFEYRIYNEGIGYHAKNFPHLIELIEVALNQGMGEREKEFINEIYPPNLRGKAGITAANQLRDIASSLGYST